MGRTQISAYVSDSTKARLDQLVLDRGMTKAAVIERALLSYLQGLEELPADVIIAPAVLVTPRTFEQILDLNEGPPRPTEAMRALFAESDSEGD